MSDTQQQSFQKLLVAQRLYDAQVALKRAEQEFQNVFGATCMERKQSNSGRGGYGSRGNRGRSHSTHRQRNQHPRRRPQDSPQTVPDAISGIPVVW